MCGGIRLVKKQSGALATGKGGGGEESGSLAAVFLRAHPGGFAITLGLRRDESARGQWRGYCVGLATPREVGIQ